MTDRHSTQSSNMPCQILSVALSPFRKRSARATRDPSSLPIATEGKSFEPQRARTISPHSDPKPAPYCPARLRPAIPDTMYRASVTVHGLSSEFVGAIQLLPAHQSLSTSPSRTRRSRRNVASIMRHSCRLTQLRKKFNLLFSKHFRPLIKSHHLQGRRCAKRNE
jgi:hypothetical protein